MLQEALNSGGTPSEDIRLLIKATDYARQAAQSRGNLPQVTKDDNHAQGSVLPCPFNPPPEFLGCAVRRRRARGKGALRKLRRVRE